MLCGVKRRREYRRVAKPIAGGLSAGPLSLKATVEELPWSGYKKTFAEAKVFV